MAARSAARIEESADPPSRPTFPIVGVGASAGGLEAFAELLSSLPADTAIGLVLVQHLDPKHESALVGLLARTSQMGVIEVKDGTRVEPGRVHVIPPNASMTIAGGVLHLAPRSDAVEHR